MTPTMNADLLRMPIRFDARKRSMHMQALRFSGIALRSWMTFGSRSNWLSRPCISAGARRSCSACGSVAIEPGLAIPFIVSRSSPFCSS